MAYEELYHDILNEIKKSINTKDELMYNKIYFVLLKWYKEKYEEKLKKYCNNNDAFSIKNCLIEIKNICKLPDINKLEETFHDKHYEDFSKLSNEIFEMVKNKINNKLDNTNINYDEYLKKINTFDKKISNVLQNKYKKEKSECLLDLEFLKNNCKVDAYSFRCYDLLRANNK